MRLRNIALMIVTAWFFIGGIGHFAAPGFFLKIVPPHLPWRLQAVYISGFFELAGAAGLLFAQTRRRAGIGLFLLTIAVTPANIYMWQNPQLFPSIPQALLAWRLVLQVLLLAAIWIAAISGAPAPGSGRTDSTPAP